MGRFHFWFCESEECIQLDDVNFECLEVYLGQIRLRRSWFLFGVDLKSSEHLLYKFNKALIQYTPGRVAAKFGTVLIYSGRMKAREILYEIMYFQSKFLPNDSYEMCEIINYVMSYEQANKLFVYDIYNDL